MSHNVQCFKSEWSHCGSVSCHPGPDLVPDPVFAITLKVELHTSSFLYSSFNRFYLFYFLKTTFKRFGGFILLFLIFLYFNRSRQTVYTCKSQSSRPTRIYSLLLLRREISIGAPSRESNPGLPYRKQTTFLKFWIRTRITLKIVCILPVSWRLDFNQ